MNLTQHFLTRNNCYKAGKKIKVKGLMLHSTGVNNPKLSRYVDDPSLGAISPGHWNQPRPGGRDVCVHGFIGKDKDGKVRTIQTLPFNYRGWHAGGSANDGYIAFEICEADLNDGAYFAQVYKEAVEVYAYLCKLEGLTEKDIICHSEGHTLGIASNHGDVMHWFPKHGKSMNAFRADVKALLNGAPKPATPKSVSQPTSKSASKPAAPSQNGSKTQSIKAFQSWLGVPADGVYGPKTKAAAIKRLQSELNKQTGSRLVVDGVWGVKTKAACVTVKRGSTGNITKIIQGMLYCLGFNPNGFDGSFGTGTFNAVEAFQKTKKIGVDGAVGPNTFGNMFS